MATQTPTLESDVAEPDWSATRWSVVECGWKELRPDLPDEMSALLATPVVVSAQVPASGAEPVPEPADEPERYPSPLEPCGSAGSGRRD